MTILIDLEKCLDSTNKNTLFEHLEKIKFPYSLINLIGNIYTSFDAYFITSRGKHIRFNTINGIL